MAIAHIHPTRTGTEPDIQALERRLVEGERKIALAQARGQDTTRLIDFWIDLLHQYESAVDSLPEAA